LHSLISEYRKSDWVCQAAAFGTQEFADLFALDGYAGENGVDRIDHQNHSDGRLAPGDTLERRNGPWRFIIQNCEVLLLKIGNRRPGPRSDDNVQMDFSVGSWGWCAV
jgi:hypothetical protein